MHSKRLKKYTKNIRLLTKRRRYKRKNSIRNKILHGGDVRTLLFDCDGKKYTLTKDRGSFTFGVPGVGKYKLNEQSKDEVTSFIIPETDLSTFISNLVLPKNINITHQLYEQLFKEYQNSLKVNGAPFHFTSLYKKLDELIFNELIFVCDNKGYTLTKGWWGGYTLKPLLTPPAEPEQETISIESSGVDDFISKLILKITSDQNERIINTLHTTLKINESLYFKTKQNTYNFKFADLLFELNRQPKTHIKQSTLLSLSPKVSILEFYEKFYINSNEFYRKYNELPNNNILRKRFIELFSLYKYIQQEIIDYTNTFNKVNIKKILSLYQKRNNDNTIESIPLSKINPTLSKLIEQPNKLILIGNDRYGALYSVLLGNTQRLLKVINPPTGHIDDVWSFITNRMREIITYYKISTKYNDQFCKFIDIYCNFKLHKPIQIYILMEYGGNILRNIMTDHRLVDIKDEQIKHYIHNWLLNTAKGLKYMHENKFAHLDINPDNIVIDTEFNSKLINLGARQFFEQDISASIITTYTYMPLEIDSPHFIIYSGKQYDNYSLGITFIECAFAFHYREKYIKISSNPIFHSILRYVPPSIEEQELPTETLKLFTISSDRINNLTVKSFDEPKTTTIISENTYTLGDLYADMMQIHIKYPILKKMIEIDRNKRISIDDVITELTVL